MNISLEGAGIILTLHTTILVDGRLLFYNNSAAKYGGAILVMTQTMVNLLQFFTVVYCQYLPRNPCNSKSHSLLVSLLSRQHCGIELQASAI